MNLEDSIPIIDIINQHAKQYSNMGADYSVTDLILPPKIVHLRKRHHKEFAKEELDKILPSIVGTAGHNYIEYLLKKAILAKNSPKNYITEKRLFDRILGRKISGQFDLFYDGHLIDLKFTKTYKYQKKDFNEWEEQLNFYAYLLNNHDYKVKDISIYAFFTNWMTNQYRHNYPKKSVEIIPLNFWENDETEEIFRSRVSRLVDHEQTEDEDLPECTSKDRWEKETKYAVKNGEKPKARRVFNTWDAAQQWIGDNSTAKNNAFWIEIRKGENTRCEKYCRVRPWCKQYEKIQQKKI